MDIDKIQRINSLASELRKHNFANSSQDAFQQAEQIEQGGQVSVQETVQESVQEPVREESSEQLDTKRTELLIEMNNKKYEQEFSLLRSALNSLSGELENVKSQLSKLKEQQPKEVQKPLKTEPKKEEPHPRQGNVTPDDVDIQKMLYFGNK